MRAGHGGRSAGTAGGQAAVRCALDVNCTAAAVELLSCDSDGCRQQSIRSGGLQQQPPSHNSVIACPGPDMLALPRGREVHV
jgi:hypothetical protein